jgi:hypothetical protein
MPDPLAPPPRRPMPERLRRRISHDIAEAPASRTRPRTVVIPIAAAAVLGAVVVVGATALGDRGRVGPVETASPYSVTPSPTVSASTPTPLPTPRPSKTAAASLDVRPMTKAEIAADTKVCRRDGLADEFPRRGTLRTRYAMVQRRAGTGGPAAQEVRVLISPMRPDTWSARTAATTRVVEVS